MVEGNNDLEQHDHAELVSRRRWLSRAAFGAAAVAGGAIAGAGVASARAVTARREQVTFDVACLGQTFRDQIFPNPPEPGDLRGTTFSVEGWIYAGGTILGDGFVPTEEGSIGRWFCSGSNITSAERDIPHVNATANFVFGSITEDRPFPPDVLVTSGLGVAPGSPQRSQMPITGGAGRYFGAMGQAGRVVSSHNTTIFFGTEDPSPNFLYTFDLMILDT